MNVKFLSCVLTLNIFLTLHPAAKKIEAGDVKPATTWVAVQKQEGSDCGYHAIYNGIKEYIKLSTGNEVLDLSAKTLAAWRTAVVKYRKDAGRTSPEELKGGWLDDGEVEFLIARHLNDIPLPAAQLADAKKHLTVIPNVVAFNYQKQDITKEVSDLDKNNALHIFILGNMVQNDPHQHGHWIATVVANKNRKLHYYGLDSLNANPQIYVNALAQIVNTDINVLSLLANPAVDTAEAQLMVRKNPMQALNILSDYVTLAQHSNALNKAAFAQRKQEIANLIMPLASSADASVAQKAQELLQVLNIKAVTPPPFNPQAPTKLLHAQLKDAIIAGDIERAQKLMGIGAQLSNEDFNILRKGHAGALIKLGIVPPAPRMPTPPPAP